MSAEKKTGRLWLAFLRLSVVAGVLFAGVLIPPTMFVAFTSAKVAQRIEAMPLELPEGVVSQRTKVLAADGTTMAYFYSENREDIELTDISPVMLSAVLAIEDNRFYEHGAFDVKGTLRAAVNNAMGKSVQGGSTITQQLMKMTLAQYASSPEELAAATESTVTRKIRELKYAIDYEKTNTKDEILADYLNLSYFGDGAYGISSAANHYFSVDASELNLPQAALLAGLLKSPSNYDPTQNPERAIERRNTVLAVMAQNGHITEAQAEAAMATELDLQLSALGNGCSSSYGAFACDYVRRYLLADPDLGETVKERRQLLESGGLIIHSTFDAEMLKAANKAVKKHVDPKDKAIGVLAMIEPGTGGVKAVAQSRPMGRDAKQGQTFINFGVPEAYGDSGGFQAGSTFKLFTAVAALKTGISPKKTYNSPPVITMPKGAYENCAEKPSAAWRVRNAGGSGTRDMYTGFRNSVNTYFAQLERDAGLCETVRTAQSMGITVPERDQIPPFTLGMTSVSPLDVAAAYATVAAQGQYCEPRPVNRIEDRNGNLLKEYLPKCEQVMEADVANVVNDILIGVQKPGGFGGNRGLGLDVPSAAKTGTVQENRGVWYAGYTPTLATVAMISGVNSKGQPITLVGQKIKGRKLQMGQAFGSSLAGPMWGDAMQQIDDNLPNQKFVKPSKEFVDSLEK